MVDEDVAVDCRDSSDRRADDADAEFFDRRGVGHDRQLTLFGIGVA